MNKLRAITTALAIGLTLSAVGAQASTTVYTSESSFAAATSALTNYVFPFVGEEFSGTSYSLGPVTFTSSSLYSINDGAFDVAPSGVFPYLANSSSLLTIDSTTAALGLYLGSYSADAQTVTYTINGVIGTLSVPSPNSTTFIGFVGDSPVHVTFTNDHELDTIRFATTAAAPVPEPETYAMLLAGLGLLAGVARRKQK